MTDPDFPAQSGNDDDGDQRDELGRFRPGNVVCRRGGRPPALDVRSIIERRAAERGEDLAVATCQVMDALHEQAVKGDVAAARAWLERMHGAVRIDVAAAVATTAPVDWQARDSLKSLLASPTAFAAVLGELAERTADVHPRRRASEDSPVAGDDGAQRAGVVEVLPPQGSEPEAILGQSEAPDSAIPDGPVDSAPTIPAPRFASIAARIAWERNL